MVGIRLSVRNQPMPPLLISLLALAGFLINGIFGRRSSMSLFMFFMLVLVLGANYLILFVGWEDVGLCSYLLIGFYFDKTFATNAGNKAFIVNRIGDFGFALAMFYIFKNFGSLDFATVFTQAASAPEWVLTIIALLLLVGACGKSAQIPLYVWL